MDDGQSLRPGQRIEQYTIERVLGSGGFGITYLATDSKLGLEVAIKEFLPAEYAIREAGSATVRARTGRDGDVAFGLRRFLDEGRALARFNHPNIVRVLSFIEANGTAYLVMEFVAGRTLADYLRSSSEALTEAQVLGIAVPILRGLSVVHAGGFLHRDIKPGNIYLRRDGEPLLIDFGAARQALGEHSRSVTGIVSAGYAPPEQYSSDGKKQGAWTDLYGLGATLYRCISGEDPV
ncbi:MAG: serine/threonine-protein kinase, partial [Gammaproteobacteria bacterium]